METIGGTIGEGQEGSPVRIAPGSLQITGRELWEFRQLFALFVWREVRVRYRQTLLGAAWAVIQPLSSVLVFSVVFGRVAGLPSDGIPYPLFSFAAFLPWIYFSKAVSGASASLVGNSGLISRVYFPRSLIPASVVVAHLVDFGVAFVYLLVLMIFYKKGEISFSLIALVPLTAWMTLVALSVSLWLSALQVHFRDVGHAMGYFLQLLMFATPVVYPLSLFPQRYRFLISLNPMTGVIEGFRSALFQRPWEWGPLALGALVTLILLGGGFHLFSQLERTFADKM